MSHFRIVAICLLLAVCNLAHGQNRKYAVSGQVVDSVTSLPLANVNISIVGTSSGGTTNAAGEFSLTVNRLPAVLYFSYVGYEIGSYQVEKSGEKNIRIELVPEVQEIDEVTVRGERISKVIRGDTLNIFDYEISGDRIFLLASPYRQTYDQRIYLATLNGDTLDHISVKRAGKQIKFSDEMMPRYDFLFRDFTGTVQFLDKKSAHEVLARNNKLVFGYDTPYEDFLGRVMPVKVEMMGSLIFQVANLTESFTLFFGMGRPEGEILKYVRDKKGTTRTLGAELMAMAPRSADFNKNVRAPLFRKNNELFVFDFFEGNIEVFDSNLKRNRYIPIDFQYTTIHEALFFEYQDIDAKNFTQTILFDEKAGKAYAFYRQRSDNRQSLREINLETGKIDLIIEIPDFPNVSDIRVYDNVVYFLYDTKVYPFYRLLYRMAVNPS